MNRHAYLIMAHNNFEILKRLITLIDDERNDLFIHIDKKAKRFPFTEYAALPQYSRIYLFQETDARWGDASQIKLEFFLFRKAFQTCHYAYFHLLSGVDLPLKSQDYIHAFFNAHVSTEFIGFTTPQQRNFQERVTKIHLFPRHFKVKSRRMAKSLERLRERFIRFQHKCRYNRFKQAGKLMIGPTWISVTHELVKYLLEKEKETLQQYKYSRCGDEVFLQTIIGNSPFYKRIYKKEEGNDNLSCMRHIDWLRGGPYVFRNDDFDELMSSDRLFARKFDQDIDMEIVERIYDKLKTVPNREIR